MDLNDRYLLQKIFPWKPESTVQENGPRKWAEERGADREREGQLTAELSSVLPHMTEANLVGNPSPSSPLPRGQTKLSGGCVVFV
jgi:hypothetical protein